MKLFLRDQMSLIFIYLVQLFLIGLIYWLDGYRNVRISIYAAILSSCIFIGYLIFRYVKNRVFYQHLENSLTSFDDFMSDLPRTPLGEGLHQLLTSLFYHYKSDLQNYKYKLDGHIQFINQWVHQMKTPLSVIHLMVQNEDDERFIAISDELDRMKKGLEMVLHTARLDTFERDFHVETLYLDKVVRAVTSNQKRLFIRKRVYPSIQIDHTLKIASDEKWLSFVITQLVTNAIRYTVHEGRKIYFTGYKQGIHKVLEVRDEGIGISKSDISRVFDPYFTGENGRRFHESTGMGLYLVKQICEKLGHQVEIESVVNEGTTVRVIF